MALAELTRAVATAMGTIARKADVGQGTCYRDFPNREALVLEIYRHEMRQAAGTAAMSLDTREPERAPRERMDRLARFAKAKAGPAGGDPPGHEHVR